MKIFKFPGKAGLISYYLTNLKANLILFTRLRLATYFFLGGGNDWCLKIKTRVLSVGGELSVERTNL